LYTSLNFSQRPKPSALYLQAARICPGKGYRKAGGTPPIGDHEKPPAAEIKFDP